MKSPALLPPVLKKGDTLAVIAPAGQMTDISTFTGGINILKDMGFRVKFPRELWPGSGFLADTDWNRAQEFNKLVADPEVQGLITMRGGYGCLRMVDKIDLEQLKNNPKMIVGFSDITVLQNYLYKKIGLVSLHGPSVSSLSNATPASLERLYHCLLGNYHVQVSFPKKEILHDSPTAKGYLVGGNLASLMTILGTSYDYSWDKKIVFLEDTNEPLYKIDRMFTQLFLAGKFNTISGLILGDFSSSSHQDDIERLRYKEQIWNRVIELCDKFNFPIWANFPCGHCSENLTLPLGIMAEMNREKSMLFFK